MHIGQAHCCTSSFSVWVEGILWTPDKTQKPLDSRRLIVRVSNWQHNFKFHNYSCCYGSVTTVVIQLHPIPFCTGDTTFNKSRLAARKKSHVLDDHFPFITYWVSTRVSKTGHFRVILNGPRELDGPLLSRLKGGGKQLLQKGNSSLHLKVNLEASCCLDCWSHYCLAINSWHRLFHLFVFYKALLYKDRGSWFFLLESLFMGR